MVSRSWPIDLFYIAKSMNQIDAWFDVIWMVMTPRKVAIRRWVYMTTSYFPTNLLEHLVGEVGFEPTTFRFQAEHADQTALLSVIC